LLRPLLLRPLLLALLLLLLLAQGWSALLGESPAHLILQGPLLLQALLPRLLQPLGGLPAVLPLMLLPLMLHG
jgi:hypothetical protein